MRDHCGLRPVYWTVPQGGLLDWEVDKTLISWGIKILSACVGMLLFALMCLLRREYHPRGRLLRAYHELSGLLQERGRQNGWYRRREKWLVKNGAAFHYGKHVEPIRLLAVQSVMAALGGGILGGRSVIFAMFAAAMLFCLPSGLLVYLNRQDNRRLLPELKLVYHAMEIQIRAGVYVTDALAECYGAVHERRLRAALLTLAGDIVMKADICDALSSFQEKFDNRHVDSLCIIVLQALESGQAVELLNDIGEQLKDMEAVLMEQKKGKLDRTITLYQLCVLAVVLGIALYACVSYMFRSAAGF